MLVIRFGPPTPEAIQFIADNMREADAIEVWAANKHTPIEALDLSVRHSHTCMIVYDDDIPLTALGLVLRGFLSDTGVPWLLSAEQALDHRKEFLRLSPSVIDKMLQIRPKLVNHVHVGNKLSIRWLKWLGFTIEDPEPMKATGELFHRFHKER